MRLAAAAAAAADAIAMLSNGTRLFINTIRAVSERSEVPTFGDSRYRHDYAYILSRSAAHVAH